MANRQYYKISALQKASMSSDNRIEKACVNAMNNGVYQPYVPVKVNVSFYTDGRFSHIVVDTRKEEKASKNKWLSGSITRKNPAYVSYHVFTFCCWAITLDELIKLIKERVYQCRLILLGEHTEEPSTTPPEDAYQTKVDQQEIKELESI